MESPPRDRRFPTTHWTLIARLKSEDSEDAHRALGELCAQYHYPLYCYIRWRGLAHHEAQDALHDFLAKLLRLEALKTADEKKGRLRTFLATSLQRYLISRHRDDHHRAREIALDDDVEKRFLNEEFSHELTPERVLERSWAVSVLQGTLLDVAATQDKAGKSVQFQVLQPFLNPEEGEADYTKASQTLGISEGAARQAVKRLREKFRIHLRKRIAETLSHPSPALIDEEIKALRDVMCAGNGEG